MSSVYKPNFIVTITGPSGSGKTTLLNRLVKHEKFYPIISTTTRDPRPREKDGVDYHFVKKSDWNSNVMVEQTEFGGNLYGLSAFDILDAINNHPISIVIVDRAGAAAFKRKFLRNVYNLYISIDELRAKTFLSKRDGKAAAKERQRVDKKSNLFNSDGFDCVITNDSDMKDLYNNFMNFITAIMYSRKMEAVKNVQR